MGNTRTRPPAISTVAVPAGNSMGSFSTSASLKGISSSKTPSSSTRKKRLPELAGKALTAISPSATSKTPTTSSKSPFFQFTAATSFIVFHLHCTTLPVAAKGQQSLKKLILYGRSAATTMITTL